MKDRKYFTIFGWLFIVLGVCETFSKVRFHSQHVFNDLILFVSMLFDSMGGIYFLIAFGCFSLVNRRVPISIKEKSNSPINKDKMFKIFIASIAVTICAVLLGVYLIHLQTDLNQRSSENGSIYFVMGGLLIFFSLIPFLYAIQSFDNFVRKPILRFALSAVLAILGILGGIAFLQNPGNMNSYMTDNGMLIHKIAIVSFVIALVAMIFTIDAFCKIFAKKS